MKTNEKVLTNSSVQTHNSTQLKLVHPQNELTTRSGGPLTNILSGLSVSPYITTTGD